MQAQEIIRRYLSFFEERGHVILPSAPLVPENDPTVLFTTAGMHPLVPYLLGAPHPSGVKRLASCQKCVRTTDIDEVGDSRHLTFFEMLGNWSLGDYFKNDSIRWSWKFLTDPDVGLGLDPARIYVTVFRGDTDAVRDLESISIWEELFKQVGVSSEVDVPISTGGRIFSLLKDGNWWPKADAMGPCGPDTEIFYDMGEGSGALTMSDGMPDFDSGRLLEIWNNVFMELQRTVQGGHYEQLAAKNVDTGMGLERMAMVMQKVPTVFETDLFQPLRLALPSLDGGAMRIVSDHLRASVMLISDGVIPTNKDRGYVLRRLIRRAALHVQEPGTDWLKGIVSSVTKIYSNRYPHILEKSAEIERVLTDEVAKFQKTLEQGKREITKRQQLTGKDAFDLYQSYGFPLELTREYAQAHGVNLDEAEFEREFRSHQDLSRSASAGQFKSGLADTSETSTRYHTATHLLQAALRQILGEVVQQKGSNITAERLRFDFSYPEKLTVEQVHEVEALVNAEISAALPIVCETMSPEAARDSGALGFFGHKYGDSVTVYSMGEFSKEICTGPHVSNTKEVGRFRITKEEAVSAGVRRIKAVLE